MDLVYIFSSFILIMSLLVLSIIDALSFRLPDWLTLPLIILGMVSTYLMNMSIIMSFLGAAIGYGVLVGIEIGYKHIRGRDGLGRGDAKLFAAGGAWCGAMALPVILLFASVSALLFVVTLKIGLRKAVSLDSAIAFGPFLSFGIGLVYCMRGLELIPILSMF